MKNSTTLALLAIGYVAALAAVAVLVIAGIVLLLTGHVVLGLSLWAMIACAVGLVFGLAARGPL